ncbi:ATP-binding protein [Halobacteriovorax sp. ZH4_bin.1]|uniref:ATP-binding protein n=1 Tax=unclassified Halobacteriovorax TaxID=2639665 RepID=UPI0037160F7D
MKVDFERIVSLKYIIAFISIVLFTIISQALMQFFILKQESYSQVINLAGRQRMLSQRLAKQTLLYRYDSIQSDRLKLNKEIITTKELLLSSHDSLKNGSTEKGIIPAFTEDIRQQYIKLDQILKKIDHDVTCIITNCTDAHQRLENIIVDTEIFLGEMNKIVLESTDFSKSRVLSLSKLELFLFCLIILLLIYEFFKVIIPLKRKLINYLKELQEKDQVIHHSSKLATIGDLVAGVGHEINGPLTVIKGYLIRLKRELYKGSKNEEYINNSLQKIEDSSIQIENIVEGLRTFARKDEQGIVEFNLNEVTKNSVSMLDQIYENYGIDVSFENSVGELLVKGCPGKIQQVIFNLLSNAKDALEDCELKEIKVKLSSNRDTAFLRVSDTGPGISDAIKKKIFDPYFTTKKYGKGSGLGLSLSFDFIKEHGGNISIDTVVGQGTSFIIELPLA